MTFFQYLVQICQLNIGSTIEHNRPPTQNKEQSQSNKNLLFYVVGENIALAFSFMDGVALGMRQAKPEMRLKPAKKHLLRNFRVAILLKDMFLKFSELNIIYLVGVLSSTYKFSAFLFLDYT